MSAGGAAALVLHRRCGMVAGSADACEHTVLRAVADIRRNLRELTEEEGRFQRGSICLVVWDAQDFLSWICPRRGEGRRRLAEPSRAELGWGRAKDEVVPLAVL